MLTRFSAVELDTLVSLTKAAPSIVISTPNYEERSVAFLERFLDSCSSDAIDPSRVLMHFLWPQGSSTRVDILEQMKILHFGSLSQRLEKYASRLHIIAYPDGFNDKEVIDVVLESAQGFPGEPYNLIVDISCMPKRALMAVCDGIQQVNRSDDSGHPASVFFVYATPREYAALRYAQDVGEVRGYFSGRPVHQSRADHVTAVVFPSLQGYEGKLLYDALRGYLSRSLTAFVAVSGRDYQTSLATMRANQFLLEQHDVDVVYYFSLLDGIDKLSKCIGAEAELGAERAAQARMFMVAPFGPKVFAVAAYFLLRNLPTSERSLTTEIAHVSGFQYLSLYSLGFGHLVGFQLSLED